MLHSIWNLPRLESQPVFPALAADSDPLYHQGSPSKAFSKGTVRGFPGGPVVKALPSNAKGIGSISGQGAKIPHVSQPKKKNKT